MARDYLTEDLARDPARPWAPSPFGRLSRAHALSVAGDAMFTTALAGLVFFSVTRLDQARWQVALALAFTIVPFSLAAPFIGPLIDRTRGGRKWMIVALCAARGVVCLALVWFGRNQLALYPLFTLLLVLAQGYILARGALVPTTVHSDAELVKANSKLAAISGVAAVVGGAVSIVVMWVPAQLGLDVGPGASLVLAAVVYAVAAYEASLLPAARVAAAPPDETETTELHAPAILLSASALSVVRVVVGFTTFLLAFHFKDLEATDVWASRIGLVGCIVLAQVGFLVGSAVAIRVRRSIAEEQIIVAALVTIGVAGLLTSLMGEAAGAMLLAFAVGLASNSAKQSFDALVQRDAPDANRGRAFARFETRFQLFWVAGALVAVAVTIPTGLDALLVGVAGVAAAVWLVGARRRVAAADRSAPMTAAEPTLVEPRPISRSFLRRRGPVAPGPVDMALLDPDEPTVEVVTDLPVTTPMPAVEPEASALPKDDTAVWPGPPPVAPTSPGDPTLWDTAVDDEPTLVDEPPWRPRIPEDRSGLAGLFDLGDDGQDDEPVVTVPRWDAPPVPLPDDDLAAPSEAAWFVRPAAAEEKRSRARSRWDDWPGDPDDAR